LTYAERRNLALAVLAAFVILVLLSGCGTTQMRALPPYEPPLAKSDFQTVRTTAYTHTEADHLEYTNHNALGGQLRAAGPPIRRADNRSLTMALQEQAEYQRVAYNPALQPFRMDDERPARKALPAEGVLTRTVKVTRTVRGKRVVVTKKITPQIGSAAADWSRWPAGTTFRLLSTGQTYRVDDYGWALAGRNTIDLYMATPFEMNHWGAREEPIQVLRWGDPEESLRFLQPRQDYKHVRRMVLELQGREQEAADLR
jgi:3D (Asp-Asp-Asp) domain-containing protein